MALSLKGFFMLTAFLEVMGRYWHGRYSHTRHGGSGVLAPEMGTAPAAIWLGPKKQMRQQGALLIWKMLWSVGSRLSAYDAHTAFAL